jgi:hypothetical protein
MSSPGQFHLFAETCVRMAKDATLADNRAQLMDMAAAWRRLAEEAERFEQLVRDVDAAFDGPGPLDEHLRPQRRSH